MNKEQIELIEKIELYEKLDVKYILKELERSYAIHHFSDENIPLNNEHVELIIKAFSFLIEFDEEFFQKFQDAKEIIETKNKVADTEINEYLLSENEIYLLSHKMLEIDNFSEEFEEIRWKINMLWLEFARKHGEFYNSYQTKNIAIGRDNSGNIITGDYNTIIRQSDIDYEQKLKFIIDKLPFGGIVFNAPKTIIQEESKQVTLRISKKSIKTDDLPKENFQLEQKVKISSFMSAKLMSFDFNIMALNHEEQLIDDETFTEWLWDITPKVQKEKGRLYLRITIRIPLSSDKEERKDLPIFERSIDILVK